MKSDLPQRLASWAVNKRIERGESVTQVSIGTGLSRASIYRLEAGNQSFTVDKFERLCRHFDCCPSEFWSQVE